jgi:hypothetical protein
VNQSPISTYVQDHDSDADEKQTKQTEANRTPHPRPQLSQAATDQHEDGHATSLLFDLRVHGQSTFVHVPDHHGHHPAAADSMEVLGTLPIKQSPAR